MDDHFSYRRYEDDDVEVKEAGKCGFGAFAVRRFLPGELVIEVTGQLLKKSEYDGSDYVMELSDELYLEPTTPGAFLNHSCSPNCELIQLTDESLGVVAICNIEPGTELTFDYGWEAFDWTPKCHCGTANCWGWVVALDEVKKMKKLAKRRSKS
ncbi:MAG: SET domain-containing protein-lysine N-methyltransferase [Planctomycetota bacterium]